MPPRIHVSKSFDGLAGVCHRAYSITRIATIARGPALRLERHIVLITVLAIGCGSATSSAASTSADGVPLTAYDGTNQGTVEPSSTAP